MTFLDANVCHEVERPISQCQSTQSEKTQHNYNTGE